MIYQNIVRPLLFRCDAEWAHDQAIAWSARAQRLPGITRLSSCVHRVADPRLNVEIAEIPFANPVGLAAGYDKSGRAIALMESLGFGHIEIGSVSATPSSGNSRPRLWRLPDDQAICVHYGLPNEGADAVAQNLGRQQIGVPLGINLVNTNHALCVPMSSADAILDDYQTSANTLKEHASYFMLNLSCPNTADGRGFFDQTGVL